jgi:hypothetical protein
MRKYANVKARYPAAAIPGVTNIRNENRRRISDNIGV